MSSSDLIMNYDFLVYELHDLLQVTPSDPYINGSSHSWIIIGNKNKIIALVSGRSS